MAKIVGIYAVPHTPSFVEEVRSKGESAEPAQFFSIVRSYLEQTRADAIATISNDHFNTFFFDKLPTFTIGIAERTAGPNDQTPGRPRYGLAIETDAAKHILFSLIQDGFDFMSSMDFEIDHGALVPQPFMHAFSIPSRISVGIY